MIKLTDLLEQKLHPTKTNSTMLTENNIRNDIQQFVNKLNAQFSKSYQYDITFGQKYAKITSTPKLGSGKSAWGFIALEDNPSKGFIKGDLLKPAGYNTPAKHARGNIYDGNTKYSQYGVAYLR